MDILYDIPEVKYIMIGMIPSIISLFIVIIYNSCCKRDIVDYEERIHRNVAIIQGLLLTQGKTIDRLDKIELNMEDLFEGYENLDNQMKECCESFALTDKFIEKTEQRFFKIQKNFTLFETFISQCQDELKYIKNYLFVPDDENSEDSDYENVSQSK
uniref:Transmembrane protein n=1 Tax=Pithovirus LCPAC302 TaxID=2506593 RepID=A0A481Z7B9_9VIRU|nr:MAG: hypothetical protein LCPAC302_00450 [Pithovirus LCPAC302]